MTFSFLFGIHILGMKILGGNPHIGSGSQTIFLKEICFDAYFRFKVKVSTANQGQ